METGMETGNGNWKQKWEQQTHQSCTGATFFHSVLSHYLSIPLSSRYGTGFMTHVSPFIPITDGLVIYTIRIMP